MLDFKRFGTKKMPGLFKRAEIGDICREMCIIYRVDDRKVQLVWPIFSTKKGCYLTIASSNVVNRINLFNKLYRQRVFIFLPIAGFNGCNDNTYQLQDSKSNQEWNPNQNDR